MIEIYHGNGKGKTTASVGLAVRAVGNGLPVIFAQFLKDGSSAEIKVLKNLPGVQYFKPDVFNGFAFKMTSLQKKAQLESNLRMLDRISRAVSRLASETEGSAAESRTNRTASDFSNIQGSSEETKCEIPEAEGTSEETKSETPEAEPHEKAGKENPLSSEVPPVRGLIVLDESLHAVRLGLLPEQSFLSFLDRIPSDFEIVLTGWEPTDALRERADYITAFKKEKHPFDRGIPARKGVEF